MEERPTYFSASAKSAGRMAEMARLAAEERLRRRRRVLIVGVVVPALLGMGIILYVQGGPEERTPFTVPFTLVGLAFLALSAFSLIQWYLQTGFRPVSLDVEFELGNASRVAESDTREYIDRFNKTVQADLARMREEVQLSREEMRELASFNEQITEEQRAQLVAELKAKIDQESARGLLDDIRAQAAAAAKRDARDQALSDLFGHSKARLGQELIALGRRGNLNLGLGAVMALIGLGALAVSVWQEVTVTRSLTELASHFAPRLTLVIFIELFAYFFLSLYKSSLQEIKYFQNELTNVEAKQIALRAAVEAGDPAMLKTMVDALAATERNHILSKDQSTVELERAKIDVQGRGETIKALSELLKTKDKRSD